MIHNLGLASPYESSCYSLLNQIGFEDSVVQFLFFVNSDEDVVMWH